MALKLPGQHPAGVPSATPVSKVIVEPPVMEEWQHEVSLPSCLFLGPSGSGKSNGIAQLLNAGLKIGYHVGFSEGYQIGARQGFALGHQHGYGAGYFDATKGLPPMKAYRPFVKSVLQGAVVPYRVNPWD